MKFQQFKIWVNSFKPWLDKYSVPFWLICWTIYAVGFFTLFTSNENVFKFIFSSMFENPEAGPSMIVAVIIPIGGAFGIYLLNRRTKANANQYELARISHDFDKTTEYEKQLDEALDSLSPEATPISWQRGLSRIVGLIKHSPESFAEFGITQLIKIGETFSKMNTMTNVHGQVTNEWDELNTLDNPEHNDFIAEILDNIQLLHAFFVNENENAPNIMFENYTVHPKSKGSKHQIANGYFEGFMFSDCNFLGIDFTLCNFYDTVLLGDCNFNIHRSLLGNFSFGGVGGYNQDTVKIRSCYMWPLEEGVVDPDTVIAIFGSEKARHIKPLNYSDFAKWQNDPAPRQVISYAVRMETNQS